jgi:hypothetical protein
MGENRGTLWATFRIPFESWVPESCVYRLGYRTTGESQTTIMKFLAPLDRSQLEGLDATKEMQKARIEQRIIEVRAFRDSLRDKNNAERLRKALEQSTGPQGCICLSESAST